MNNIGKFIREKDPWSTVPNYFIIAGYDQFNGKYIKREIEQADTSVVYTSVSEDHLKELLTIEDVLNEIHNQRGKDKTLLDKLRSPAKNAESCLQYQNYKNEYHHLLNSFKETEQEYERLQNEKQEYIRYGMTSDADRIDVIMHEVSVGMKRINKRMHFFFGEQDENIKQMIRDNHMMRNIDDMIVYLKKRIQKEENQITAIERIKSKM